MKRTLLLTLLLTFIWGGMMAQTGMEIKDDMLYDYTANWKYKLIKAPTQAEGGEALLAGPCDKDKQFTDYVRDVLYVAKETPVSGSGYQWKNDYSLTYGFKITGVADDAFNYNDCGLSSLTLPNGVKTIGRNAFRGCSKLTTLKMPTALETIGDNAFYFCGLTGELSLENCSALKSLGTECFQSCNGITSVVLPAHAVTMAKECFRACVNLTTVKNVSCLPYYCFSECKALQSVSVLPGFKITTIEDGCFRDCNNLESVSDVSSVETLGGYCFGKCQKLTSIAFWGNNVKIIGYACFKDCTGLSAVDIPATVETLGGLSFGDCTNLTTLKFLGNNVKTMGSSCFRGTSVANNLVLPASLETLGDDASHGGGDVFRYYNDGCKGVTIPASVSQIGTLYSTREEASFIFLGKTPPTLLDGGKVSSKWTFYVPRTSVEAYKAAFPDVNVDAIPNYQYYDCEFSPANSPDAGSIDNKFGTICLPRQGDYTSGMAKLYTVVGISADNKVQLREVEDGVLRAGVPYIYKTDDSRNKVHVWCSGVAVSEPDNSGLLKSTFTEGSFVPVGAYVLQFTTSGKSIDNKFHIVKSKSFEFTPYRAYLQLPEEVNASALRLDFGEATGIESVATDKHEADGVVYDLSGRRVQQPRSGFYIKNGKKYIIK